MRVPGPEETQLRVIVQAVRELAQGGTNAIGGSTFSLRTAPNLTTTVSDSNIPASAVIQLIPTTANGAIAIGAGAYVSAVAAGSFTVTHTSSASADRTFRYQVLRP